MQHRCVSQESYEHMTALYDRVLNVKHGSRQNNHWISKSQPHSCPWPVDSNLEGN